MEQKRIPNCKKIAKMVGFLLFGGSIAAIGQIQQRANHPYRADRTKNAQSPCGYNGPKPANEGIWARGGIGKSYPIAQNKSGAH